MKLRQSSKEERTGRDRQNIDRQTIEVAYLKGLVYAHRQIARFNNHGMTAVISAEDVTHTALVKIFDGTRSWNPEKTPDLFVHLAGCIKGEISTCYRSADSRLLDRGISAEQLDRVESLEKTQEELEELKRMVQVILLYIEQHRQDLLEIATVMYESEISKPRDIADELSMSVNDVNIKKFALKRMLKSNRFVIHYVVETHAHLESVAKTVLRENLKRAKEIAEYLEIPESEARIKRDEFFGICDDLHKDLV